MSTKRKKPPIRNFRILLARAAAEVKPGGNIAHVKHDDWSGAVSILIRCATCQRYYCGSHSISVCKDGQHWQTRAVANG